jgi:phytoene dehydrogenase-like protein
MPRAFDAVIVGAGPNGLSAAIVLAQAGRSVLVLEANDTIGGGCRSGEVTLPGFTHDLCAAVHPMALVSRAFRDLPLQQHGLEWVHPPAALAHPFDDGSAAVLYRDAELTGSTIAPDGEAWVHLMRPFLRHAEALFDETMRPVRVPRHPLLMARFGLSALQSCTTLISRRFHGAAARALFTGCAAHSFLPMDATASSAIGLVIALVGHATDWPIVRGGSQRLANALAAHLCSIGGTIETGRRVRSLADLPAHHQALFDVAPRALDQIAGDALPEGYRRRLRAFRHGPGVFKIDFALSGPIPWRAEVCRQAGTVHLGATHEEIAESERAAWDGRVADRPFVLVAQQSLFDDSRAPRGQHTGWAYCHVPHGSTVDMSERIERQIERFAPGFRDLVLARHTMSTADVEAYNATMIGGDVAGGANDLAQMLARPFARWNPYSTPNPALFLCSGSTPPGGGVHGMCGYWAAHAALQRMP